MNIFCEMLRMSGWLCLLVFIIWGFRIFVKKTNLGKKVRNLIFGNKVIACFTAAFSILILYPLVRIILSMIFKSEWTSSLIELLAVGITVFWAGLGIYEMARENSENSFKNKINEKYGALLGNLSFMWCGICDELLPFSKRDIETALLTQAINYKSKGDQESINIMVHGYIKLAMFIHREKYDIVREAYLPDGLSSIKANAELKEKFFKIQDEIMNDTKKRAEHINKVLGIIEDASGKK